MDRFDVLVIGSGSGMIIAANAVNNGLRTALVESGKLGGTCLNRGCVPSKMLIYPADVLAAIQEAENIGISATVSNIDFRSIMDRMHDLVAEDVERQTRAVEADKRIKWFKEQGEFVSDYTLSVGGETIKADKIFIVSGARADVPPIKGLDNVRYLTSDTVLELKKLPKSLIILGGGYIAAEYGHFFAALGTQVTVIQRNLRLVPEEEPEVSELLREELEKRMGIFTGHEAVEVAEENNAVTVTARYLGDSSIKEFSAEATLVATGRVPNADRLKPQKTGVEVDKRGFVMVNEFLETRKKNIWAFGDAIGKQMFKHVANYEAQVTWHNSTHEHKIRMDYSAAPHAVFTHPQIASVGIGEREAKRQSDKIMVGVSYYKDTAQGAAMGNPRGFVKVILERKTGKILGAHIIGPFASSLIQEITNAMSSGDRTFAPIVRGMHVHPAMSEVVQSAFANLKEA
jgi:dihydrolipoamide dehydrogenase